ncbi:MAG: hypothetical protein ABI377_07290 [Devosia sp.]
MATANRYLAELVRALCVLGLLLFVATPGASPEFSQNYSQVGVSAAVAASVAEAKLSPLCGGGWGDDQLCHAPCHACRANLPILPPAPSVAEPAFQSIVPVRYAALVIPPVRRTFALLPPSRGPPVG